MKTLLALPLLIVATGTALADTYTMTSTDYTANIKVSVSGGCKFKQTFQNAKIGTIRNETTNKYYNGALSASNQLLLLFEDQIIPYMDAKGVQNLSSGKISVTQRATLTSSVHDEAITELLNMACAPTRTYTNFYDARLVENKALLRRKQANGGVPSNTTVSYNNKGTIETWVIDPTKAVNSDTTAGNIRTQIIKQKADKTKIKISYHTKLSL